MDAGVFCEITTIPSSIPTTRMLALVGALPCVDASVRREMATRLRSVPTARMLALVGAISSRVFHCYKLTPLLQTGSLQVVS